jgi:hypothetical protein
VHRCPTITVLLRLEAQRQQSLAQARGAHMHLHAELGKAESRYEAGDASANHNSRSKRLSGR